MAGCESVTNQTLMLRNGDPFHSLSQFTEEFWEWARTESMGRESSHLNSDWPRVLSQRPLGKDLSAKLTLVLGQR